MKDRKNVGAAFDMVVSLMEAGEPLSALAYAKECAAACSDTWIFDNETQSRAISEICLGCGCTESIEEIRKKNPDVLGCCPDREMVSIEELHERLYEKECLVEDLRLNENRFRRAVRRMEHELHQAYLELHRLGVRSWVI